MHLFSVQIEMSGEAFRPDPGDEVARVLRRLADEVEGGQELAGGLLMKLKDSERLDCGYWSVVVT